MTAEAPGAGGDESGDAGPSAAASKEPAGSGAAASFPVTRPDAKATEVGPGPRPRAVPGTAAVRAVSRPQDGGGEPTGGEAAGGDWRFLGLAHGQYAVFETGAGLVLLDRRAAHERVAYEEILRQYEETSPPSQALLFPVPLELDAVGAGAMEDHRAFLKASGFVVEPFGRHFFRVESVPAWVDHDRVEPFLRDLIGLMRDGNLPEDRPALAREQIARLAALRAVRVSDRATEGEMTRLVQRLLACRQPLTNPQGRPTFIELDRGELDRRFQKR